MNRRTQKQLARVRSARTKSAPPRPETIRRRLADAAVAHARSVVRTEAWSWDRVLGEIRPGLPLSEARLHLYEKTWHPIRAYRELAALQVREALRADYQASAERWASPRLFVEGIGYGPRGFAPPQGWAALATEAVWWLSMREYGPCPAAAVQELRRRVPVGTTITLRGQAYSLQDAGVTAA